MAAVSTACPWGFFADLPDDHFEPSIDAIGKNLAPVFAPPQDVKLIVKGRRCGDAYHRI
jgi:hypothetical protein